MMARIMPMLTFRVKTSFSRKTPKKTPITIFIFTIGMTLVIGAFSRARKTKIVAKAAATPPRMLYPRTSLASKEAPLLARRYMPTRIWVTNWVEIKMTCERRGFEPEASLTKNHITPYSTTQAKEYMIQFIRTLRRYRCQKG